MVGNLLQPPPLKRGRKGEITPREKPLLQRKWKKRRPSGTYERFGVKEELAEGIDSRVTTVTLRLISARGSKKGPILEGRGKGAGGSSSWCGIDLGDEKKSRSPI